jgi:hypothetical protein
LRGEDIQEAATKLDRIATCPGIQPTLKDSPMYILRALAKVQFKISGADVMFRWINASIGQPPSRLTDPRDKNQRK